MAIKPLTPVFMADSIFSVAADDYAAQITSVTIVPTTSIVTFKGLKAGATVSRATSPEWQCTVAFTQDWSTTGLSTYLLANQGKSVAVTFKPESATGASFTVNLILVAGSIGGAIDTYASDSVTFGVVGVPVQVAATA